MLFFVSSELQIVSKIVFLQRPTFGQLQKSLFCFVRPSASVRIRFLLLRRIILLTWNHAANTALGVGYVALVSWDDVHVAVEDRLPRSLANIDADVVAIGVVTLVNLLHHIFLHHIHRLLFMVCQVSIGSHVTLRNNQRMTGRYRITIVECNTSSRLSDNFHISGKIAEMASYSIFPWQLIEVVILI